MAEEDLPDLHRSSVKKERLVTKKRWDKMTAEYMELLKNGSEMNPKEAFRIIKQMDMAVNPYISEERRNRARVVRTLEKEILRREGLNPEEWIYFTSVQPQAGWDTPFTDEDMKRIAKQLPSGLELFVIPGQVSPGSNHLKANYTTIDHFWSVFVRLKPHEISTTPPAIEPPKDN